MAIELDWHLHPDASCLHALAAMSQGLRLADPALESALEPGANVLWEQLAATHTPLRWFLAHLVPLSATIDGTAALAKQALVKTLGFHHSAETDAGVAAALSVLQHAFKAHLPNLRQELQLRVGPLTEQWEARGPGLIRAFASQTEADLAVPSARVLLVHPALGGHAEAHLWYNSVRIEALLANPVPALPEVLRLAWTLAQLQLDLGKYQGDLPRERIEELGRLAMIPAVLSAAEAVELSAADEVTIELALEAWRVAEPACPDLARKLLDWWAVYQQSRPAFHTALVALDRFLGLPQ